jgi:Holliday junction resolvase RusA-like endonuclease
VSTIVTFEVLGQPAGQGSKTRMPNGAMLEGKSANQRALHGNWRTAVAEAARTARTTLPTALDGPLRCTVRFRFPMPASRSKKVRVAGQAWKRSAPDLDKLQRALGDGLKAGGLIVDDALIVHWDATKVETIDWTGATVVVRTMEEGPS